MTQTLGGIAALAVTGFMIAFVVLMAFMALIQPLWCIVDCAIDGERGTGSKVIWVILLIALYGVANWFYGAFAAAPGALRRLTRLAWAFAILLALFFAFMYWSSDEFRRGIEREYRERQQIFVQHRAPLDGLAIPDLAQVPSFTRRHVSRMTACAASATPLTRPSSACSSAGASFRCSNSWSMLAMKCA